MVTCPGSWGRGWDTQATLGSGYFLTYMEASCYVTIRKCIPLKTSPTCDVEEARVFVPKSQVGKLRLRKL